MREELRAYRVEGRVQGVGFRWWTRGVARGLEICGTVRNAPDGSVQVVAVGSRAQLERLEAALELGPPASRVDVVKRATPPEPGSVEHMSFEIIA